jgi:hypothetical protein
VDVCLLCVVLFLFVSWFALFVCLFVFDESMCLCVFVCVCVSRYAV